MRATRRSRSTSTPPTRRATGRPGAASDAWRHRSLAALDADLRLRGSRLRCFFGPSLADAADAGRGHAARRRCSGTAATSRRSRQRDARIKQKLRGQGVRAESFNGALLFEPWTLQTQAGHAVQGVHSVLARGAGRLAAGRRWRTRRPRCPRRRRARRRRTGRAEAGADARLGSPASGTMDARRGRRARRAGDVHSTARCAATPTQRDRPDRVGTSRLSPHLHFGEIAPWRVVHALRAQRGAANAQRHRCRDQANWAGASSPTTCCTISRTRPTQNFNPRFNDFDWARVDAGSAGGLAARAAPACRSSMPACASCGPPAGCTTACA